MDTFDLPKDCPKPRLCHLIKWSDFNGYGFNLHAEKLRIGQYIGKVDDNSPAFFAGLREGDRIIEVNGVNIANENHKQVVERIKSLPNETKLLVLDEASDKWYKEKKIIVKSNQFNVIYMKTPSSRPSANDNAFNEIKENLKTSEDVLNNNNNINNNYLQEKLKQKNEKNVKDENANCDQTCTTLESQANSSFTSSGSSTKPTKTEKCRHSSDASQTSSGRDRKSGTESPVSAKSSSNLNTPLSSDIQTGLDELNLNMTVSEMRQLLASRKKNDPKKAQLDLKTKYNILQHM